MKTLMIPKSASVRTLGAAENIVRCSALYLLVLAFFWFACCPFAAWGAVNGFSDSEITAAIERGLIQNPLVKSDQVDVETHRGVVTLSGMVSQLLAKERATEIAGSVKGVRSIVSKSGYFSEDAL